MCRPGYGASLLFTVAGMLLSLSQSSAQGIASGNAAPAARPKSSGKPFDAKFVDIAQQAGLTMRFVQGSPTHRKYIVESNGTGVAFLDADNDGWLDIFLVNGSRFTSGPSATNHLYRNNGKGKFTDITASSGTGRSGWGNGVCAGDYDNDGRTDLYVTYWGVNSLFHNKGDGIFEDVAASSSVAGPKEEWSTGCTFLDYDRDGHLDLFVTSYVAFDLKKTPLPGTAPNCIFKDQPVFCGPRGLPHGALTLYHNRGDGTFEDVSQKAQIRTASPCYAFTAIAADLNDDAWTDLYVACDSTPSLYFRNNKDGTFSELGTEAGIAYNENGTEQAGMGIAVADFNNDGTLDLTKTNFIGDYPNLYRNLGKGVFEDAVISAGLGINPQYVLWGTGLEDFDNDGLRDVFQVSGHVFNGMPDEPWAGPRLLYRNLGGGRFEEISAVPGKHSSRGTAFADFDNDGDVDVLIMNMDEPPSLLRNDLQSSRKWLQVRLRGTKSNRSAIGAIVTVHAAGHKQTAPVLSQSSFLSSSDLRLHFGLGDADKVERVIVRWPSGSTQEFTDIKVNSIAELVEQ